MSNTICDSNVILRSQEGERSYGTVTAGEINFHHLLGIILLCAAQKKTHLAQQKYPTMFVLHFYRVRAYNIGI